MSFPNSHVKVLTPNMMAFGDGALKEVNKPIWVRKGGALTLDKD